MTSPLSPTNLPCNKQQGNRTIHLVVVTTLAAVIVAVAVTVAVTVTVTVIMAMTVAMTVAMMVMVSVSMLSFLDNEMAAFFPKLIQVHIVIQRLLDGTGSPSHKHVVFVYILITR